MMSNETEKREQIQHQTVACYHNKGPLLVAQRGMKLQNRALWSVCMWRGCVGSTEGRTDINSMAQKCDAVCKYGRSQKALLTAGAQAGLRPGPCYSPSEGGLTQVRLTSCPGVYSLPLDTKDTPFRLYRCVNEFGVLGENTTVMVVERTSAHTGDRRGSPSLSLTGQRRAGIPLNKWHFHLFFPGVLIITFQPVRCFSLLNSLCVSCL